MPSVQQKRGTRAALNALATANGIKPGEIYLITDEARIAIGLTISTYETYLKESETAQGPQGPAGNDGADGTNVTITIAADQAAFDAATPGPTELVVLE